MSFTVETSTHLYQVIIISHVEVRNLNKLNN